jgi:hypothetical protein
MDKTLKRQRPSFQFETANGQLLSERITEIEKLAGQALQNGTDAETILRGATRLLEVACAGLVSRTDCQWLGKA